MNAANPLAADLAKAAKKLADALETGGLTPPALMPSALTPLGLAPVSADVCAQTIAYGMFVGWWRYGEMEEKFTRQTAAKYIPKSHPFLDQLFDYIASPDVDERVRTIADELADLLQRAATTEDATIHFYEHFLAAYNPDSRKSHGVFYTPQPVVKYIVRAVDDILRQEFKLQDGIADKAVPILDPATGTGTFLLAVIARTFSRIVSQYGRKAWNNYAANDLLPRLHGFEVLSAPYLIAHLELAMLLQNMDCQLEEHQRFNIHLANALEANLETSITVVLGNPPYSVSTINRGKRSKDLIANYKKDLNETKTNLDDDYIKFIALGQQLIERNTSGGILAYISNNSFLGGVTHRNMRKSLLQTFDKIYILNLHGDARKKETAADGSKDENVFNIMQGTSINIFVRSPSRRTTLCPLQRGGSVFYADLYGKRSEKFNFLETQSLKTSGFTEIIPAEKYYFFVPKNLSVKTEYEKGFGVAELFLTYNSGIKTDRDLLFIDNDKDLLADRFKKLLSGDFDESFRKKYRIADSSSYKITKAIQNKNFDRTFLHRVSYRPFDEKWIYYDPSIVSRAGKKVLQHMLHGNIALLTSRLIPSNHAFNRVFVTTTLADGHAISDQTYVFPLYLYDSSGERHVNLKPEIVGKIADQTGNQVSEMDIFDYIYGVLHDPKYRTAYQEFLTIDFPRVPYPMDAATFDRYVRVGSHLRKLHLLKDVPKIQTTFPVSGDDTIEDVRFADGKVLINKTQYFDGVPIEVWEFYVGDYRPAQKYLKDRKGCVLTSEEILHYQTIVAVLNETASELLTDRSFYDSFRDKANPYGDGMAAKRIIDLLEG